MNTDLLAIKSVKCRCDTGAGNKGAPVQGLVHSVAAELLGLVECTSGEEMLVRSVLFAC